MKQVRCNVFETNSSSTHTITVCTEDEWERFAGGELMYDRFYDKLIPTSPDLSGTYQYCTYETFGECEYGSLETYSYQFITPSGDKMVAFGTYGGRC